MASPPIRLCILSLIDVSVWVRWFMVRVKRFRCQDSHVQRGLCSVQVIPLQIKYGSQFFLFVVRYHARRVFMFMSSNCISAQTSYSYARYFRQQVVIAAASRDLGERIAREAESLGCKPVVVDTDRHSVTRVCWSAAFDTDQQHGTVSVEWCA